MSDYVLAAGGMLALYDFLSGNGGQTLTITDNITTNMSITAVTNVQTDCFQSVEGSQTINITSGASNPFTTLSPGPCETCEKALYSIYAARQALEAAAAEANPGYTPQMANSVLQGIMITGQQNPTTPTVSAASETLGPCTAMCSDLVIINTSQSEAFSAQQTCTVKTDVTTNIAQSIKGQIDAYLKNQQDIIGQLESAFTSNTDSMATNLSSVLSQNLTQDFTETLHQQMYNAQTLSITGNSVLVDRVTQSFNGKMVGQLTVNNTVTDNLRQSAQYSIAQTLLNKNDTIGDLTKDFLQVIQTMSELLEELTSQILIIIGAIIAAVIFMVGALYIFNKNFRGWFKSKVNAAADAEIDKLRGKAFGQNYVIEEEQ